tara:strand:+ start:134 stop:586 length:453 start_codon:yes stop_codon:yes gene_type:complete
METIVSQALNLGMIVMYLVLTLAAITMPIWAYKIIEAKFINKHDALKTKFQHGAASTQIIASLGTTTAGVFMIQILPLIFSIVGDVGADFGIANIYAEFSPGAVGVSDYADNFYALTAQLGDMLQTISPMAAVGLGGYNLINKLSRGLPA